ncbi:MAG: mRNA surveillance protein pelota [Thermoplasmata archaeon]|nr:mRNA surveillance protein pelota [Thermoplasmata archaeon]
MRVLKKDLRGGTVKLLVENGDDLWHLRHLIQPGDVVHAVTWRREERSTDMIRAEKTERRRMYLGIEVEDVEYADFSDRLRILGIIRDGPDDVPHGTHHTLNIEEGDDVKIQKTSWMHLELDRIDEAVKATRRPHVIIICIDDESAVFAAVRQSGVERLSEIPGPGSQKGVDKPPKGIKEAWLQELMEEMDRVRTAQLPVVLVGPGFTRTELLAYVRDRRPDLAANVYTEGTGQSGIVGVQEAIKRGLVSRVVEGARVEMETEMVQQLLAGIGRGDNMVSYGVDEVLAAIRAGAVDTVLVSDDVVREGPMVALLTKAESLGSRILVVSIAHDAGERLSRLGGIAALHRYPYDPRDS